MVAPRLTPRGFGLVVVLTLAISLATSSVGSGVVERHVSGVVRDENGTGFAASIVALDWDSGDPVALVASESDGTYELHVPSGTYMVVASDSEGLRPDAWWTDATGPGSATPIVVGSSDRSGIDFVMGPGVTVAGIVRDYGGNRIPDAQVSLCEPDGFERHLALTDADGEFTIPGVSPGPAVVRTQIGEYWEYLAGTQEIASATVIDVPYGGVDVIIALDAPAISGATRLDGHALAGVRVEMLDSSSVPIASAMSGPDGSWRIWGMSAGTYTPAACTRTGMDSSLAPLNIGSASTLTGVDFGFFGGGRLSGTVRNQTGQPVSGATVECYNSVGLLVSTTVAASDGTFEFTPMEADSYKLRAESGDSQSWYPAEDSFDSGLSVAVPFGGSVSGIDPALSIRIPTTHRRLAGGNRYSTAVRVSREAFPGGAATVVLCTGENWPDALGGSALAGAYDAPLLLTGGTVLPSEVAGELRRLGARRAIILGGLSAVSGGVESSIEAIVGAGRVSRIGGTSRYETSRLVARRLVQRLSSQGEAFDGTVILATGLSFPDALGASALSAARCWPIILTEPSSLGSENTRMIRTELGATEALVLGSSSAVGQAVEARLCELLGRSAVVRISGSDRYKTAVAIAEYSAEWCGLDWSSPALATGMQFPDALAGGAMQGSRRSVLLLTPPDTLARGVASLLEEYGTGAIGVTYLGGTSALSSVVESQVRSLLD